MKKMKTLESYFRDEIENGNLDHALRVSILSDGRVYFYIHPATASGDTQDYTVDYNRLTTHDGRPAPDGPWDCGTSCGWDAVYAATIAAALSKVKTTPSPDGGQGVGR